MHATKGLDRVAVILVLAAFVGAPLVIMRGASGTMPPKAALVTLIAALLLGLLVTRSVLQRRLALPRGAVGVTTGVLAAAFIWSAVHAPVWESALLGPPMRMSGLVMYLACLVLLWTVVVIFRPEDVSLLAQWGLVTIAINVVIVALQVSPLGVIGPAGSQPVRAILGNTNFASALLGMGVPLAVWGALQRDWRSVWRVTAILLACAAFGFALWSRSIQGPIIALVGVAVVGAAVALERFERPAPILTGLGAAGAALAATGIYGLATSSGPLGFLADRASIGPRLWYWEAAIAMAQANPVSGVGLGMYPGNYTIFRSVESVRDLPFGIVADDAHSVPLNLVAEGGLILLLAYTAFVVAVGVCLISGLRRLRGDDRLLLGAVGGAWAAFQTQSLISIDVAALMPWHYVLAGAVVVISHPEPVWTLPPSSPASQRKGRRQERQPVLAAVTAGLLLAAVGGWAAVQPLRANLAIERGKAYIEADMPVDAVEAFDAARAALPFSAEALFGSGVAIGRAGEGPRGLDMMVAAVELDPFDRGLVGNLADVATRVDETELAYSLYMDYLDLDPLNVQMLVAAADLADELGKPGDARALLERAEAIDPHARDVLERRNERAG